MAALGAWLPAALNDTNRPADNAERLAFTGIFGHETRYSAAARLWSEALAADPKLDDDRPAEHR